MALPGSGPISLGQVNTELGRASNAPISLNESAVRSLAGKPSGAISMSDLLGKSSVTFTATNTSNSYISQGVQYTCSVPAIWTFTRISGSTASTSPGAGVASTSAYVNLTGGTINNSRSCRYTVTGTANGVTRSWTEELTVGAA